MSRIKHDKVSGIRAFTVAALAAVSLATLGGCAYTQTVNERTLEREQLRAELDYEQQRNRELRN